MKKEVTLSVEEYNQLRNHMFPVFLHQNFPFFYERGRFHDDLLHDFLLFVLEHLEQGTEVSNQKIVSFLSEKIKFYETFL